MQPNCYKVIKKLQNGRRISAVLKENHPLCLDYSKEWVLPKVGLILAFSNLKDACHFCRIEKGIDSSLEIWSAEGTLIKVIVTLSNAIFDYMESVECVKDFWGGYTYSPIYSWEAPRGTIGCSMLRLVKKVRVNSSELSKY